MLTYRNEAAFSRALVTAMRNKKWFVQRIESGETGKGIPDLYTIAPGGMAMWIELKRERCSLPRDGFVEIHWRPGQQSWLNDVVLRKQRAFTIACFDNGIITIPHCDIYPHNKVLLDLCSYSKDIKELLK